jgi:son of sevenless-like protein
LAYQPAEVAQQMTLVEWSIFRSIRLEEFTKGAWSKAAKRDTSPNVLKLIENSNGIVRWVATEIITTPNLKKRISVLKHFITIASVLLVIIGNSLMFF